MNVQIERNAAGDSVKTAAGVALVAAGCAICCAPLIAAPVLGLLSAAGIGLALAGKIGLGVLVVTGLLIYLFAKSRRPLVPATTGCDCAPDGGCNTGSACDLPARKPGLVERGRNIMRSIC